MGERLVHAFTGKTQSGGWAETVSTCKCLFPELQAPAWEGSVGNTDSHRCQRDKVSRKDTATT